MKKGLLILMAAITAGILAYYLSREHSSPQTNQVWLDSMPELAWLRTDLKLTDEQFSKVEQLHRDYRPVCAEMCRRISESKAAVAKLSKSEGEMTTDLATAIKNHGNVIAECKRSMLDHLYKTAAQMDEQQAKRYLEATLPLALDTAHSRNATHNHE